MPTSGQLALLTLAVALLTVGLGTSYARRWRDDAWLRIGSKSALYWGTAAAVGVLCWHSIARRSWMPMTDNFDALVWLAVLLAGFTAYVQGTRPLAALDWFLMPVVILLLAGAAVLGRTDFRPYVGKTWMTVHLLSSFGGAVAFGIAAASGAMYLWASVRLRRKQPVGPYLGSLERLEDLTMSAVTLGFALLSVGIVIGVVELVRMGHATSPAKIALAMSVWLVYAVVLHAPINPVFRGRRAALLSVVGFFLMIGAIVAAQFGR